RAPSFAENGSALGWAHSTMAPLSFTCSSGRAEIGDAIEAKRNTTKILNHGSNLVCTSILRLQIADVAQQRLNLRIVEAAAEGRHLAFLALADAVQDEFVIALGVHQLRPDAAGDAAAALMAPATGRVENIGGILVGVRGAFGGERGRRKQPQHHRQNQKTHRIIPKKSKGRSNRPAPSLDRSSAYFNV